jgi:L-alanine-DL-glutamate epimerase-like enolase superfamily enzyme
MMLNSDVRVLEAQPYFSDEKAREPLKFGASVMDQVTYCHVRVRVENRRGQVADGWGAIFLSDFWAFPTPRIEHAVRDQAMRRVTQAVCARFAEYKEWGHPLDIFWALEPELAGINQRICAAMALPEEMPFLGALVCASPVDAALHDAFGNVNGISSYAGYGPDWVSHDLSTYLGEGLRGRYLCEFVRPEFAPTVPVFHLVGGLDKLRASDASAGGPQDGRPNSLEQWLAQDRVYCLKVKLRGTDLAWDVDRTLAVYRIAREMLAARGRTELHLSADTNEQCESPAYMVEYLHHLKEQAPGAYAALLYVEQPTERDLTAHRYDMRALAALKPVIVDESLTGLSEMSLALELGWSGVALKTCKCHSMALLTAARAEAAGIPYTIQDLTNPGLSLLHSVGLGARLHPLMGVEANSRQYYPDTSRPEAAVHGDLIGVRDGVAHTASLSGTGLGYRVERIDRPIFRANPIGRGQGA